MNKTLTTLAALVAALALYAQAPKDLNKELARLLKVACSLRQGGDTQRRQAFNVAVETLGADKEWTPMDELTNEKGECPVADKSVARFRLNAALHRAERQRKGLTAAPGHFLNGESESYAFSLFEKTVAAKGTVSYTLKGRSGRQVLLVVPYHGKDARLAVTLLYGDQKAVGQLADDGVVYLQPTFKIKKGDRLTLQIANEGDEGEAMVILNHNTRK